MLHSEPGCKHGLNMSTELSPAASRFKQLLEQRGHVFDVVELPTSARTAKDAAASIGCSVAQIAKSLIFRGAETGDAVLAIVSGTNQADTGKLAALAGEQIGKADADFVRMQTGYAIGGVPPTGHKQTLRTWIDADLLQFDEIWAAAGTPHAVFGMPALRLTEVTGGTVADIKQ